MIVRIRWQVQAPGQLGGVDPMLHTHPEIANRGLTPPPGRWQVPCSSSLQAVRLRFSTRPPHKANPGPVAGVHMAAMQTSGRSRSLPARLSSSTERGSSTTISDEYLYRCMRGDWADLRPGVYACMRTCVHVCTSVGVSVVSACYPSSAVPSVCVVLA